MFSASLLSALLHFVFPHLREAPMPKVAAKKLRKALNTPHAQNLCEGNVDRRRVRFGFQHAGCLIEEVRVKHKIRPFHVYSIP